METAAGSASRPASWKAFRLLVAASVVSLLALVLAVFLHALLSAGWLVLPIQVLASVFAVAAVGGVAAGGVYAWSAYPKHRRALLAIALITGATFTAHAYVMGSPPAYTVQTASGPVGTPFSNGKINVTSSVSGNLLTVAVTSQSQHVGDSIQCCVIAGLKLENSSGALAGTGFAAPPTLASPLRPAATAVGTWVLTKPVNTLNITYDSLTCYSIDRQEYGCIMDEIYYVPEAMGILAGQQCTTGDNAPSDCHMEHPPLSAALIAAGMAVLGEYNSAGWRLFPALLGTLSIPVLFGIAWKLSENKRLALVAATLLALDVMFFSQSGGALLDVPQVFFGLAAFLAYFAGVKWWKFDKYIVAGVLLGLAGVAKETAVFIVLAFVTYVLVFERGPGREKAISALKVILVVGLVFAAGVQAYDSTLATAVPSFASQVNYILTYGSGLNAGCPWACGWANQALGGYITPLEWLVYYSPVGYYVTNVSTCTGSACSGYVGLGYYGVTNFLETWTVFVWVPLVAFELYRYGKARRAPPEEPLDPAVAPVTGPPELAGDQRLGAFALLYFGWTYLPYIPLFLAGRVTYPFYIIPAIPALALGAAWWGTRDYFPRWLLTLYLVMAFGFFLVYFPDKSFLPVWVRVLLRH